MALPIIPDAVTIQVISILADISGLIEINDYRRYKKVAKC